MGIVLAAVGCAANGDEEVVSAPAMNLTSRLSAETQMVPFTASVGDVTLEGTIAAVSLANQGVADAINSELRACATDAIPGWGRVGPASLTVNAQVLYNERGVLSVVVFVAPTTEDAARRPGIGSRVFDLETAQVIQLKDALDFGGREMLATSCKAQLHSMGLRELFESCDDAAHGSSTSTGMYRVSRSGLYMHPNIDEAYRLKEQGVGSTWAALTGHITDPRIRAVAAW